MKKQGTLIIACLAAAAAGVAIGMLIAPDSGENLRKNAKKVVGDWADKIAAMMNKAGSADHVGNTPEPESGSSPTSGLN